MKKLALGLPVLVLATAAVAATARGSESDRGRYTTAAPLGAADPPGSHGRSLALKRTALVKNSPVLP